MRERTADRARGKWRGILRELGIAESYLTGKHGPCIFCQGKDRYRFTDKNGDGVTFCSQCGSRSGFQLLMELRGWDFQQAASEVDKVLGIVKTEPKREQNDSQKREAMNRLWRSAKRITMTDPAGLWLARRVGLTEFPDCLRFAPELAYRDGAEMRRFPAMVAKMTAPDGKPTIIHRTYLTARGTRPDGIEQRKMMPGTIARGSAIRLAEAASELGIAEGIETALAASRLHTTPVWACLTEGLLQAWEPPPEVEKIIIFGDNDANFVGQAAAYALAKRLVRQGKSVEVRIPESVKDWNDVLQQESEVIEHRGSTPITQTVPAGGPNHSRQPGSPETGVNNGIL